MFSIITSGLRDALASSTRYMLVRLALRCFYQAGAFGVNGRREGSSVALFRKGGKALILNKHLTLD